MSGFLFSFDAVPAKSRIVLYGAGECGQAFYNQVKATGYCEVAIWLDRNADEARQNFGMPVYLPDKIKEIDFDFVVIAISNLRIAEDAAEQLSKDYDIPINKFVTKVIDLNLHKVLKSWGEYAFIGRDRNRELEEIAPNELVNPKRLDIVARWLLCRDFVYGIENAANLSLYTRMQLTRVQGLANLDFWTDNPKENVDEMLCECKKLCQSIRQNGFDRSKPIPLSSRNNVIIDGSHRLGASLAAESKIWAKYYGNVTGGENYGFDWFVENGFNNDDLIRVLRGFCELYSKSLGIVVLYGTVIDEWDYIQSAFSKDFTIVGSIEIDFSHNFYAYETLIREIYSDPQYNNPYNDFKLRFLEKAPLKIRLLLIGESGQQEKDIPFYEKLKRLKMTLRDSMYFETGTAPCVIHTSDNRYEFNVLKKLLLSSNNLRYLDRRIVSNYSDVLLERLSRARKELSKCGIPLDDCVIVGSSVMEILGLCPARDLDIIVHSRHRDRLGNEMHNLDGDIEIYPVNKIRLGVRDDFIPNDNIVVNDDLHFIFHGWKVINLEIYKSHLAWHIVRPIFAHAKEKNEQKIRRIRLFEDFVLHYDDKAALRLQIQKEFFGKRYIV
jgi:hypothetical protein